MIEGLATGTLAGALLMWLHVRHLERVAHREALKVAHGHGRISGRVMRQIGERQPSAWPSNDPQMDAFNKGARRGWREADTEIRQAERWVVREAERITKGAA